MEKEIIFNNYISKCPNCQAELSPDDKLCPYCGENLEELNKEFKDKEQQVVDAMKDVDRANRHLYSTELLVEKNSYKKSKERRKLIVLFVVLGIIASFLLFAGLGTILEMAEDKKVEELEQLLLNQRVDTIVIDKIPDADLQNFTNTKQQSSVGYLMENDKYSKVPFFSDSLYNDAKFRTEIVFDKLNPDEVYTFDEDYLGISGDGFSLHISADNSIYHENAMDVITLTTYDLGESERLDNVVISDIEFEVYRTGSDYHMVANPYPDFFVSVEMHYYDYNHEIIQKYNEANGTNFDTETETLPFEVFNKLRQISIEMS